MAALRVPTNVEQSSIATLNILPASLLLCTLYGSNNDTLGGWHDIRSEEEGGTVMLKYTARERCFCVSFLFVIGVR